MPACKHASAPATECVARSDWCEKEGDHCKYGIRRCCDV